MRWIKRAADQGYAPAQYNLGLLYFRNRGVIGDDAEAATWYRRAAEQGYAPAQGGLGYMLAYGAGVDKNHVQAYMWFELAWNGAPSDLTRQLYTQQRDELAQRMTVEQITDAKRLAGEWDEANPRQPESSSNSGQSEDEQHVATTRLLDLRRQPPVIDTTARGDGDVLYAVVHV